MTFAAWKSLVLHAIEGDHRGQGSSESEKLKAVFKAVRDNSGLAHEQRKDLYLIAIDNGNKKMVVFETLAQISLEPDGPQYLRGNVAIEVFAHAIEALSKTEEEVNENVFLNLIQEIESRNLRPTDKCFINSYPKFSPLMCRDQFQLHRKTRGLTLPGECYVIVINKVATEEDAKTIYGCFMLDQKVKSDLRQRSDDMKAALTERFGLTEEQIIAISVPDDMAALPGPDQVKNQWGKRQHEDSGGWGGDKRAADDGEKKTSRLRSLARSD